MARKITLPAQTVSEIINLYRGGLSCPKIGAQFNLSRTYIQELLKKHDVICREYHELNHKHTVNEHLFDCIDTQEKAYFLGMLFSDGNVHSKCNSITLKLHKRDKELLATLSHIVLGKEHLLKTENNLQLKFSSRHMKQRLIELGCVPNKSLILRFPEISSQMLPHFIRGYIDGDGSIYQYDNDFAVTLMSTENFCMSVRKIISEVMDIDGSVSKDPTMLKNGNDITSILLYRGNRRVAKILDWLYRDATIFLERKHRKYMELKRLIVEVDKRTKRYHRFNQYSWFVDIT